MSTHHRVALPAGTLVGEPCNVPDFLVGLEQVSLDDLGWADPALGFSGQGLWPLEITDPTYDPGTEILTGGLTELVPVKSRKVVKAKRGKRDLTPEEIAERNPVPLAVTPLQMRKALREAGLRPQVDSYVATLSEEAREAWEYCVEVRRDDPFIAAAADALGMTADQRDGLFRLAASL